MKLVLYRDCSQTSNTVRAFLENHGLDFEEVDARTGEGYRRLVQRTQQTTVPALEIKRSHSVQVVAGFNEQLLIKELRLE